LGSLCNFAPAALAVIGKGWVVNQSTRAAAIGSSCFISATMHLAMVSAAQWNRELVTHLAAECRRLRKAQVVRIGWTPTTDHARLLGYRFDVIKVANAARRRQCEHTFIDSRSMPLATWRVD